MFTRHLISLKRAARLAGKRPSYLRRLIEEGTLKAYVAGVINAGKPDERPILKVVPAEAEEAIRRAMEYRPAAPRSRRETKPRRPQGRPLHPGVRC